MGPQTSVSVPALPGAVGISSLTVYADGNVDGHAGGSAHAHLVCSEAYYVVSGRGAVQTLGAQGYTETDLRAGVVLQLGPGTIHRLVNEDELRLLVIMQNGGLPEAGDAVLTLPPEHLSSRERYDAAAALPHHRATEQAGRRRDLSVDGFTRLREACARAGPQALMPFYTAAAALVRPLLGDWKDRWRSGAHRDAVGTSRRIEALASGDVGHLLEATVVVQPEPAERGRLGMCGHLDTYAARADPGTGWPQ